jgi:hypothetical protein
MSSRAATLGFTRIKDNEYEHPKMPGVIVSFNPHGRFIYKGELLNYDPSWDASYDPRDEESGTYYPDDVKRLGIFLLQEIVAKLSDMMHPIFAKFYKSGFVNGRTKIHDGAFMACLHNLKLKVHPGVIYTINPNYTVIEIDNDDFLKANIELPTIWNPKNSSQQNVAPNIQEELHKIYMAISNLTLEIQSLKQPRAKK